MTIYTGQLAGKEEKPIGKSDGYTELKIECPPTPRSQSTPAGVIIARANRASKNFRCALTILLGLSALIVIVMCLSGFLIYRHWHRNRYSSVCRVRFGDEDVYGKMVSLPDGKVQSQDYYPEDWILGLGSPFQNYFVEHFEVSDDLEKIDVQPPDISNGDHVWIWHDFNRELTAYRDFDTNECYVRSLDVANTKPPTTMIDLLKLLQDPELVPNFTVVREKMRVVGQIHDKDQLGPHLSKLCETVPTYSLMEVTEDELPIVADSMPGLVVNEDLFEEKDSQEVVYEMPEPVARRRRSADLGRAMRFRYSDAAIHVVELV